MADERFFTKQGPKTLREICEISGASIHHNADPDKVIDDLAPLDSADGDKLSFFDNVKYKEQFKATKAGACFVSEGAIKFAPDNVVLLISDAPYKAYALTAQAFYPDNFPETNICSTAHIDDSANIAEGCIIEANVVIESGVEVGAGTWIGANSVIRKNVSIGSRCRIGAGVTVSHALIGDDVRLYTGVRIGQDGFGFAIDPAGHVKVPQLGRVVIEDHVEIGANTTIDRGAGPDTVIGQGTWIDNLVQIGHNVKIGKGCVIVAQVGISGSTVLEDFVVAGGQVGIAGHLHIGAGAQIGAQAGVMRDIPAGEVQMGSPALPMKQSLRHVAALNRLIKNGK